MLTNGVHNINYELSIVDNNYIVLMAERINKNDF